MTPNVIELLREAHAACLKIIELTEGLTLEEYFQQELLRFGVNWNVVIVGEALNGALSEPDEREERLPSARRAIATRQSDRARVPHD